MRDFHLPGRSAVYAVNGLCATSHPAAALAATELLRAGGTAADAAIGAAVLLGIAEPHMTGLGGDAFALVKPAGQDTVVGLNGSGRAPAALDAATLRAAGHDRVPERGAAAVTVPGAVAAFAALSERFGKLGLDRVLAPAIAAAEEGLPVAPRVAFDWARSGPDLAGAARAFYLPDGRPPRAGTVFRAPGQATVLRRIARDGMAGFYSGLTAAEMIDTLRADGGVHTEADFAAAAADWTEPLAGFYRGVELLEHPPNGQGATALLMAAILERFELSDFDPVGADRAHIEAEAAKLAYDARNRFVADPAAMPDPRRLAAPGLADALAALIDPLKALADPAAATESLHRDTVYVTVVDRDLMAVSLIYSIYHDFGAKLATTEHGILFHNRGAGFSLVPGHPNEAAGGKRPLHTIIPAMLRENGRISTSFGVMGGAYQPAGHVRVLSNLLDYGMDLQSALDAPRTFPDADGLRVERGYRPEVHAELAGRGHRVVTPEVPIGGAQAIRIDHARGILIGASDPRKDGCAIGY